MRLRYIICGKKYLEKYYLENKQELIEKFNKNNSNFKQFNNKILFLSRHGSKAYNCHIESSDDDYKGFLAGCSNNYLGILNKIEQFELYKNNNNNKK